MEISWTRRFPRPARTDVELVERKGVGHPDTLCDAIAERASRYYSSHCLEVFGRLAHHWFDKVMLIGGEAQLGFGRGELVAPYRVIFAGKAVLHVRRQSIPCYELLHRATAEVLCETLHGFDPTRHLLVDLQVRDGRGPGQICSRYRPRTAQDLPAARAEAVSNDCNLCAAFAPFTELEQMVFDSERFLNGEAFKLANPDTGSDIKIIGTRRSASLRLLVNLPFIANLVPDRLTYRRREREVAGELESFLKEAFATVPEIVVNPEDSRGRTYLTATGSVADTGDVGCVGRGNRINGLITPMRPMSIEAASGKNPIDHSGKLYNVLAQRIATELAETTGLPATVFISTSKGRPLDDPDEVIVELESGQAVPDPADLVSRIRRQVGRVADLSDEMIGDGLVLW